MITNVQSVALLLFCFPTAKGEMWSAAAVSFSAKQFHNASFSHHACGQQKLLFFLSEKENCCIVTDGVMKSLLVIHVKCVHGKADAKYRQ